MRPQLDVRVGHRLQLTPQVHQSIRFLQLSAQELQQELAEIIEENPLLEQDMDHTEDDQFVSLTGASRFDTRRTSYDESLLYDAHLDHTSLAQFLRLEMTFLRLTAFEVLSLNMLIESLDDSGYATMTESDCRDLVLLLGEEWDASAFKIALRLLQSIGPVGVGTYSLSENLLLQLRRFFSHHGRYELAKAIVTEHLPLLAGRHHAQLKKILKCRDQALQEAIALIQQLDPRPASFFSQKPSNFIFPDVIVYQSDGQWLCKLNDTNVPKLRINHEYAKIVEKEKDSLLVERLQHARYTIRSVENRFRTLLRVCQQIVSYQKDFFDQGSFVMKPLTMKDVAQALELHESTVSRVVHGKYLLAPQGLFELRYFFCGATRAQSNSALSAIAIRALIVHWIATENRAHPLSDNQLVDFLKERGLIVARRTIAKYREKLNIFSVKQRRCLRE